MRGTACGAFTSSRVGAAATLSVGVVGSWVTSSSSSLSMSLEGAVVEAAGVAAGGSAALLWQTNDGSVPR